MNKRKSFTLVEVMVVSFILLALFAGIFSALNVGESLTPLNLAGVDAAAQARIIMTRITNDLRGAVVWDIKNYTPSSSYIKFHELQEVDFEVKDSSYVFSRDCEEDNNIETCFEDYIEYSYDEDNEMLTRSSITERVSKDEEGEVKERVIEDEVSVSFEDVMESPFFDFNFEEDNPGENELCYNCIEIKIVVKVLERGGASGASLIQRIKVRNE